MTGKTLRAGEAEDHLRMYPEIRSWVSECVLCHDRGRNPRLPDEHTRRASGGVITTAVPGNLRHYFPRYLALDEFGRCPQCAKAQDGGSVSA